MLDADASAKHHASLRGRHGVLQIESMRVQTQRFKQRTERRKELKVLRKRAADLAERGHSARRIAEECSISTRTA